LQWLALDFKFDNDITGIIKLTDLKRLCLSYLIPDGTKVLLSYKHLMNIEKGASFPNLIPTLSNISTLDISTGCRSICIPNFITQLTMLSYIRVGYHTPEEINTDRYRTERSQFYRIKSMVDIKMLY